MRSEILTRPARPWIHRLVASTTDLCDAVSALEATGGAGGLAVRVVRGRKSTTRQAFLDESSAALQFPLYFGNNWDAFYDCLTDLSWLRAEAVVLFIADAGRLLDDALVRDVEALVEVLHEAARTVNDEGRGIGPKSLHIILHTTPEEQQRYQNRWEDSDLDAADLA